MTKADLVELIYERRNIPKKDAAELVEIIFEIIKDALRRGEKVKISGFGSFIVMQKRARRGRNPQTGDAIIIEPRCVLSFKSSGVLKEKLCDEE
jgi:integration host factor subunit alpha